MEWGDFLNQTAQDVVGMKVSPLKPSTPVSTGQGGVEYEEGQPASGLSLAGIPKMYLIGGGIALALLVGYLALRK
jgi:hypothetical protein